MTLKTRTQDVLFTRKTRTHGRGSRVFFLTLGLTLTLVLCANPRRARSWTCTLAWTCTEPAPLSNCTEANDQNNIVRRGGLNGGEMHRTRSKVTIGNATDTCQSRHITTTGGFAPGPYLEQSPRPRTYSSVTSILLALRRMQTPRALHDQQVQLRLT